MSNEDFQSPAWAKHHGSLSETIHKLFKDMSVGFERLNAIEFDAPWKHAARPMRNTPRCG